MKFSHSFVTLILVGFLSACSEKSPSQTAQSDDALDHTKAAHLTKDGTYLDLRPSANRGFRDDVAGDGKGGWSDQGSDNDMGTFPTGIQSWCEISFDVIDPQRNEGRSVLTFDSWRSRTGLELTTISLQEKQQAKFLYLLHTSCWNQLSVGVPIGEIEVIFADGTSEKKLIRNGIEVADWWNPGDLPNAKLVFSRETGTSRVGVYLSRIKLSDASKPVTAVTFRTFRQCVWIVVAATLSNKEVNLSPSTVTFTSNEEWKPVDMSDVRIKAGSALDLGLLIEPAPAGHEGRVIINREGKLAFEKSPSKSRRFLGYTAFLLRRLDGKTPGETADRIKEYAELVRRQGYDALRPLALDMYLGDGAAADCEFNPVRLQNMDLLMAELKKQGVYIYLDLAAYRVGRKDFEKAMADTYNMKARMYLGEKKIRENWRAVTEQLLNHVNPYTGIAWKDEPAILCVEFYNEQELGLRLYSLDKDTRELFTHAWNQWLAKRYVSLSALVQAWKNELSAKESSWGNIELPDGLDGAEAKSRATDFGLFVADLSRENFNWCQSIVRELGYQGLVTQYNCSPRLFDSMVRSELSPVVSYNSYFAHPVGGMSAGARCNQASSVGSLADYHRGINAVKLNDRPIIVTEHNQAFWNKYQHEDGLLFSAYSALQDFDSIMVHEDSVELEVTDPVINFTVARNPVARANEFLAACLYKRGDVKASPYQVELEIPVSYLTSEGHGNQAIANEQNKIGLLTGFAISFPDSPKPPGISKAPKSNLTILPRGGAAVKSGEWAVSTSEIGGASFSLNQVIADLKARGILSPANITNPAAGIFQSDTGEITLRGQENLLKVITPRSEGVSLEAGKKESLSCLQVEGSTTPATVAVCSMDGNALAVSSRIVLVYSTEVANSGMQLSADRVSLIQLGSLSVLLRTGKLNILLKHTLNTSFDLYALALNGSRMEKIPVVRLPDGTLQIEIDTAQLKNGPTPFFELNAAK